MILLITRYKFPNEDAGSIRFYNFAVTLQKLGYEVFIIGNGKKTSQVKYYNGIPYISVRLNNRYLSYILFDYLIYKKVKSLSNKYNVTTFVIGYIGNMLLIKLKKFCTNKNIKLVNDVVEWFSVSQCKYGRWSSAYRMIDNQNRKIIDQSMSVISISSYLDNYFKEKGIKSVRIPIYMQQEPVLNVVKNNIKLVITYAGQPGKKDYLGVMLQGLSLLSNEYRSKIEFNLLGVSERKLKEMDGIDSIWSSIVHCVKAYGIVSRECVLQVLQKSDFTVLLRPQNERYAQAGFPTKVVESISMGVPVIMNFTSDLGMYFTDGVNCIQIKECTSKDCAGALLRALNLSNEEKNNMSQNAKGLAISDFNVMTYAKQLESIII